MKEWPTACHGIEIHRVIVQTFMDLTAWTSHFRDPKGQFLHIPLIVLFGDRSSAHLLFKPSVCEWHPMRRNLAHSGEELKQPRPRINNRIIYFKDAYLLLWNQCWSFVFPPLCCSVRGAKVDDIQPDTSLNVRFDSVKQLWSRYHILFSSS